MKPARFLMITSSVLGIACCLSGCGGGGGGAGLVSTPTPTPTPTGSYPKIFPSVTATTDFATLGVQVNTIPGSSVVTSGFSVRYDAGLGAYVFDLPSIEPAKFRSDGEIDSFWDATLETVGGGFPGYYMAVFKPSGNEMIDLSYTSFAVYHDYDYDDNAPAGLVAFGMATPPGGVPTTGSATYGAIVWGLTQDTGFEVQGNAQLQFDFGAGMLAGEFNPVTWSTTASAVVSLGTYNFTNTIFGVGSTTFSGDLQHSGIAALGAFNGLFTGPAAQELMARWNAPYVNPDSHQQGQMTGIWVGKKP